MKRQDIIQLKARPIPELRDMLKERREKLRHLQLDLTAGKVKNEGELRQARKDIARVLTFLKEAERTIPRN